MHPIALLLLSSLFGFAAPRTCTVETPWFIREDSPATVLLRATADSISDGEYYAGIGEPRRSPPYPGAEPRRVFAQVFELTTAAGPGTEQVHRHDRVAVIWWQRGASCQRWYPREVIRLPDGALFLAKQPRDVSEWIDGIPTYDVLAGDRYYSPVLERIARPQIDATHLMTVAEYADLFRVLPSSEALSRNRTFALKTLLAWGEHDPVRWLQHPARQALCQAKALLGSIDTQQCPEHPSM